MVKRDVLRVLAGIGLIVGLLAALSRPVAIALATRKTTLPLPVIMYHHVSNSSRYWGRDGVSVEELERDLQVLRDMGYETVLFSQVLAYLNGDGTLPEKPVALTFDDGFLNYRDMVVPLLEAYHCCATVAITGAYADTAEERDTDNPNFEYMTWEELSGLDPKVTEIAYHSYDSHYPNDRVNGRVGMKRRWKESDDAYRAYLTDEYQHFREKMAPAGQETMVVAYPFGAYSDITDEVMKELGIRVTLTCETGINLLRVGETDSLYGLKRINRPHGEDSETFFARSLTDVP